MSARIQKDPSPIKAGLVHGSASVAALTAFFGLGGGIVHLTGNADAGSPRVEIALFDQNGAASPTLKTRLPGLEEDRKLVLASLTPDTLTRRDDAEPSLGVEYGAPTGPRAAVQPATPNAQAAPTGIRINGKLVEPGQSLSQVVSGAAPKTVAVSASADQSKTVEISAAITEPVRPDTTFERFARPFENPEGKPTVSVIVGGMGINWRHTQTAIDELPAEVTLSFAPGAKNLSTWVRRARADGHEVLIEVPMEPYSYGRTRPHPQILQIAVDAETNRSRLDTLLGRVSGFNGVINYQGAKFATDNAAADVILTALNEKGLAFFEDGSLTDSVFANVARDTGVTYGGAGSVIDALPEGDPIEAQLMYLETQAMDQGVALGTAFAYPISIDMIKDWTESLEGKGIALAPASYYAREQTKARQTKPVQKGIEPINPAP